MKSIWESGWTMAKNEANVRSGRSGAAARWGATPRPKGVQVRVDIEAAAALQAVPEIDRRSVASASIKKGVKAYLTRLGKI